MLSDEEFENIEKKYQPPAGSDAYNPSQEDALPIMERWQAMNWANNPQSAVRWLKKKHPDWKVVQYGSGYNISIKKPGEDTWKVVDPDNFEPVDDLADIVSDLGVGLVSGIGGAVGGTLGSAAPGVGTIGGAIGGAAIGGATGEAVRQGAGALMGFEAPLSERAEEIGISAVAGAAGEGLGQVLKPAIKAVGKAVLPKVGRALQVPERLPGLSKDVAQQTTDIAKAAKNAKTDLEGLVVSFPNDPNIGVIKQSIESFDEGIRSVGEWGKLAKKDEVRVLLNKVDEALDTLNNTFPGQSLFGQGKQATLKASQSLKESTSSLGPIKDAITGLVNFKNLLIGGAGAMVGGLPGVAAIALPKAMSLVGKGIQQIGKELMDNPETLKAVVQQAPIKIQRLVQVALNSKTKSAYTSSLYMLLNNTDFRNWLTQRIAEESGE